MQLSLWWLFYCHWVTVMRLRYYLKRAAWKERVLERKMPGLLLSRPVSVKAVWPMCLCAVGTTVPDTHLHIKTDYSEDTQSTVSEVRSVIVAFALLWSGGPLMIELAIESFPQCHTHTHTQTKILMSKTYSGLHSPSAKASAIPGISLKCVEGSLVTKTKKHSVKHLITILPYELWGCLQVYN